MVDGDNTLLLISIICICLIPNIKLCKYKTSICPSFSLTQFSLFLVYLRPLQNFTPAILFTQPAIERTLNKSMEKLLRWYNKVTDNFLEGAE